MKAVVLLSGGLDSSVLLYFCKEQFDVSALSIHYGQKHQHELFHARRVAEAANVQHAIVKLPSFFWADAASSQVGNMLDVPHGHYAEDSMKATIVPNRNMVLLALAGAYALSQKATVIAYAAHSGDHAVYPDCRPEFVEAMQKAFGLCDWQYLSLFTPFIKETKAVIVKSGVQFKVPFELTWSCYDPQPRPDGELYHCGKCGTCVERKEAFQLAGVTDPTEYVS